MSIASLVRSLAAAGATTEMIAIAVDAVEVEKAKAVAELEAAQAKELARKAKRAEQKALERARKRDMSRDSRAPVAPLSQDCLATICDPLIPPIPLNDPQPLLPNVEVNLNPKPPFIPPFPEFPKNSPKFPKNSFDLFWSAYPNKVSKKDARRMFERAEKAGEVTFDELLAGLERYKVSKPEHHEWKHPATWLNDGCWADEYAPPVAPSPPMNGFHRPVQDFGAMADRIEAEVAKRKAARDALRH